MMDHWCEHTGVGHRGLIRVEAPSLFLLLFDHRTHIHVVSHLNAFVSFHVIAPIRLRRVGTGAYPYIGTMSARTSRQRRPRWIFVRVDRDLRDVFGPGKMQSERSAPMGRDIHLEVAGERCASLVESACHLVALRI